MTIPQRGTEVHDRAVDSADVAAQFASWVSDEHTVLLTVARGLVGPDAADDLVQDVLVQAWRHHASFDPARGTPRAWLLGIMFRTARRHGMRRVIPLANSPLNDATQADWGPGPADSVQRVWVGNAVRQLPRRQREVITLFYLADLPIQEIAALLDISVGTVKSQLSDARATLRTTLETP